MAKHDKGTLAINEGTFIGKVPLLLTDEGTLAATEGTLTADEATLTDNESTF